MERIAGVGQSERGREEFKGLSDVDLIKRVGRFAGASEPDSFR